MIHLLNCHGEWALVAFIVGNLSGVAAWWGCFAVQNRTDADYTGVEHDA